MQSNSLIPLSSYGSIGEGRPRLETAFGVSEGHPHKLSDIVADAVLDELLQRDPFSRSSIEILTTTNYMIMAGMIRCAEQFDYTAEFDRIVRQTVRQIGFDQEGFSWKTLDLATLIDSQSLDIAMGVDTASMDEGAGDNITVYGYATEETEDLMPAPICLANKILRLLSKARHADEETILGPDAYCQVTMAYEDGLPTGCTTITVSTQHSMDAYVDDVADVVMPHILEAVPNSWMCATDRLYINPSGRFVIGGPDGDVGQSGRLVSADTYGGAIPYPSKAHSGLDPTKLDRSGSYMARYIAKNIVAARIAKRCQVQIQYELGVSSPVAIYIQTFGTSEISETELEAQVAEIVDLRPRAIRERFQLQRPIYKFSNVYGAFGRNAHEVDGFPWERLDLVEDLKGIHWKSIVPRNETVTVSCNVDRPAANAATALLSFFKDILDNSISGLGSTATIRRTDSGIAMEIQVRAQHVDGVYKLLSKYADVLSGNSTAEAAFENDILVVRLQNKLDEAALMLRNEQRVIEAERRFHDREIGQLEEFNRRLIEAEKEKSAALAQRIEHADEIAQRTYADLILLLTRALDTAHSSDERWFALLRGLRQDVSIESEKLVQVFGELVALKADGRATAEQESELNATLEKLAKTDPNTFSRIKTMVLSGAIQTTVGNSMWTALSSIPWTTILP